MPTPVQAAPAALGNAASRRRGPATGPGLDRPKRERLVGTGQVGTSTHAGTSCGGRRSVGSDGDDREGMTSVPLDRELLPMAQEHALWARAATTTRLSGVANAALLPDQKHCTAPSQPERQSR